MLPWVAAFVAACVAGVLPASAAGGDLDPSFGDGGTQVTGRTFAGNSVALQVDGKSVVGGGALDGNGQTRSAVARYEIDGTLDTSFGTDGIVVTPFRTAPSCYDVANDVVVQADGKIVTVGLSYCRRALFAVARYTTQGALDPSFGTDGKVLTSFGPRDACTSHAEAATIQPDGKVIAAGVARCGAADVRLDFRYAVARYDLDGNLDPTFGDGGQIQTNFTSGYDRLADVAMTPGGKIVVVGTSADDAIEGPDPPETGFALARYRSDGALDPTFGGDGRVIRYFHSRLCGGSPVAEALAIQPDGRIVAGGMVGCAPRIGALPGPYFVVARFRVNGNLDRAFGLGGRVTTVFHVEDTAAMAYDVAIQRNGKIVAAGWAGARLANVRISFALLRLTTDGLLDRTFGGDGKVATPFGGSHCTASIRAIAIQSDGRILAVGGTCQGSTMARYLAR
jgi:uncharacterized delta-60 repeat protein